MRAAEVTLTGEQRTTLRSWLAAGKTEWRLAFRAQIILALAAGRLCALERPPAGQASGRYLQAPDLAGAAGARDLAGAAAELVHQHRSGVRTEGRGHCRALSAASGERRGVVGGRDAPHPGLGARPRLVEAAQRQSAHWLQP